jgi:hypothetical protein
MDVHRFSHGRGCPFEKLPRHPLAAFVLDSKEGTFFGDFLCASKESYPVEGPEAFLRSTPLDARGNNDAAT